MTFSHGKNAAIYANGWNLGAYLQGFSPKFGVSLEDATVFGAVAKAYIAGLKDGSLSADGLWDGAQSAVDAIVQAALGNATKSLVAWWPTGESAVGDPGYAMQSIETAYGVSSKVEGLVKTTAEFLASGGIERVISLHPLAPETAAGNGTTHDGGAASANGCSAYLHVTGFAGTSITVTLEHSVDGAAWTTLGTFVAATAAGSSERIAASGTVKRYVRAIWAGTFTTATFSVAFNREA